MPANGPLPDIGNLRMSASRRQKRSFEFEVETPLHLLFIYVPAAQCVAVQVLDCLRRKILGIECRVAPLRD
jgi:hypothetical protein